MTTALAQRCEERFEASTERLSDARRARLFYECGTGSCAGDEPFAQGAVLTVSLEVEDDGIGALMVHSADPSVADVFDVASSYDPCAKRARIWATLEALSPGATELVIESGDGLVDRIAVSVADPASITFKTSALSEFSFSAPGSELVVHVGDALVLLPEQRDAAGKLLVGTPVLDWLSASRGTVELRTEPQSDHERFVREQLGDGVVFAFAVHTGSATITSAAPNGASGTLAVRVIAPL